MTISDRPLADANREEHARTLFPIATQSPEEYAAHEGADWLTFSFGDYRYRDPVLDDWIQRLTAIFFTPGRLAEVQERYLTPDELRRVRERMNEPF